MKLLSHESKDYREPLIHFAVRTGRLVVVQFVLSAGANPFETDRQGKTVLALALEMGSKEIAECLVAAQDGSATR